MFKRKKSARLNDMPLEGKVVGIVDDAVGAGFGQLNLRTQLIIKNEYLGERQQVEFIRPGQPGDILTALINDFKADKEIKIKGTVSYDNLDNLTFAHTDKSRKELLKRVKRLAGTVDWGQVTEDEKNILADFLSIIIIPGWGYAEMRLVVSVEDKAKYLIFAGAHSFNGARLYLYKGGEENE